jgi:hypothetical protein
LRHTTKVIIHIQKDDTHCDKIKEASKRAGVAKSKDKVRELVEEFEISGKAVDQASDKEFKSKVQELVRLRT